MIQLIIGIIGIIICIGFALWCFLSEDGEYGAVGAILLLPIMMLFAVLLGIPLNTATERVYLEEIPSLSQIYTFTPSKEENVFTFYDGNVQQTLLGYYNFKTYYKEDLKQSYAEIKYNVTLRSNLFKSDNLQDYDIENIDVYLKKE